VKRWFCSERFLPVATVWQIDFLEYLQPLGIDEGDLGKDPSNPAIRSKEDNVCSKEDNVFKRGHR
jgi:hypothetical protein